MTCAQKASQVGFSWCFQPAWLMISFHRPLVHAWEARGVSCALMSGQQNHKSAQWALVLAVPWPSTTWKWHHGYLQLEGRGDNLCPARYSPSGHKTLVSRLSSHLTPFGDLRARLESRSIISEGAPWLSGFCVRGADKEPLRDAWTEEGVDLSPPHLYKANPRSLSSAGSGQGKEGGILLPSYFNSPRELLAARCLGSLLRQDEESAARPAAGLRAAASPWQRFGAGAHDQGSHGEERPALLQLVRLLLRHRGQRHPGGRHRQLLPCPRLLLQAAARERVQPPDNPLPV